MSHHFSKSDSIPDWVKEKFSESLSVDPLELVAQRLRLGATGKYPSGSLGEHDEGELQFAIAADPVRKKVLMNFGKSVASIGFDPEQAISLGELLINKGLELKSA